MGDLGRESSTATFPYLDDSSSERRSSVGARPSSAAPFPYSDRLLSEFSVIEIPTYRICACIESELSGTDHVKAGVEVGEGGGRGRTRSDRRASL